MKSFTIRVPATTANMGCGYDMLGMALKLYNVFKVRKSSGASRMEISGEGAEEISQGQDNLFWRALSRYAFEARRKPPSLIVHAHNAVPVARGLGSSATAVVAGLMCGEKLFGAVDEQRWYALAYELEGHLDNIVAARSGGITVAMRAGDKVLVKRIKPNAGMRVILGIPDIRILTEKARDVLPHEVPFSVMTQSMQNLASEIFALEKGDMTLAGSIMLKDLVHQRSRQEMLMPWMEEMFQRIMRSGAYGAYLSGSGPCIAALSSRRKESDIASVMIGVWKKNGITARARAIPVDTRGAA